MNGLDSSDRRVTDEDGPGAIPRALPSSRIEAPRSVRAVVQYAAAIAQRPRYHMTSAANDVMAFDARNVEMLNGRRLRRAPSLEQEGFRLVSAPTAVTDFEDSGQRADIYALEVGRLVQRETGASSVIVTGGGNFRFSPRSPHSGRADNWITARFVHDDLSAASAPEFARRALRGSGRRLEEFRGYAVMAVWRALSPPPQDVPLALLDARTLEAGDLVAADALFDTKGGANSGFEVFLARHNPRHRWVYFPELERDEAILFTLYARRHDRDIFVAHTSFEDPTWPDPPPRISIDARAIAFFE